MQSAECRIVVFPSEMIEKLGFVVLLNHPKVCHCEERSDVAISWYHFR